MNKFIVVQNYMHELDTMHIYGQNRMIVTYDIVADFTTH